MVLHDARSDSTRLMRCVLNENAPKWLRPSAFKLPAEVSQTVGVLPQSGSDLQRLGRQ